MEAVYDRTQADVDRVKYLNAQIQLNLATEEEVTEWQSDLKGALNRSDLTRIVGNMQTLAQNLGVTISTVSVPTFPNINWYYTLLVDIDLLRSSWTVYVTTPDTPSQPLNHYQKWNAIEKILFDMDEIYTASVSNHPYTGTELYGDDNVLI